MRRYEEKPVFGDREGERETTIDVAKGSAWIYSWNYLKRKREREIRPQKTD